MRAHIRNPLELDARTDGELVERGRDKVIVRDLQIEMSALPPERASTTTRWGAFCSASTSVFAWRSFASSSGFAEISTTELISFSSQLSGAWKR